MSLEITEKIFILKHHTASVNYVKIVISKVHAFYFRDHRSENFSWCHVIQQIKKSWPKQQKKSLSNRQWASCQGYHWTSWQAAVTVLFSMSSDDGQSICTFTFVLKRIFLLLFVQNRVATAQEKQGIWILTFPDRENTRNLVNLIFYTGKLWQHGENFWKFRFLLKILLLKWQQSDGTVLFIQTLTGNIIVE